MFCAVETLEPTEVEVLMKAMTSTAVTTTMTSPTVTTTMLSQQATATSRSPP